MGLIPLSADAKDFEFKSPDSPDSEADTLHFKLHKTCTKKDPNA